MNRITHTVTAAGSWATSKRAWLYGFAIIALITLALGGRSALAQGGTVSTLALANIVLVHGAWADGSSWSGVIGRLQKAGYHVTAVQLGLSNLEDDVAITRRALAAQSGPTILVGHSFGGAVITKLGADAPNVVGLVYVAAFAPDQGDSMKAIITGSPPQPSAAALRPDAQGFLSLDPDGFLQYFAPDVDPTEARVLAAVQKPISAAEFLSEDVFGTPTWKALPSWYLVTDNDQMIPPPAQQFFAQRMGATVSTVASSHVPMLSHPDMVANLIMTAAQSLGGGAPTIQTSPEPQITPEPRPNIQVGADGSLFFTPTGKTVRGKFLDYWNAHGGLEQFGYPISDELAEKSPTNGKSYTVQYFQRAVFELHSENQAPYDVQLALLGTFRYQSVYGDK